MKSNKLLATLACGVASCALLAFFLSHRSPAPTYSVTDENSNNNFNEQMVKDFNANVRAVSSRLDKTEDRIKQTISQERESLKQSLLTELSDKKTKLALDEVSGLKRELLQLKARFKESTLQSQNKQKKSDNFPVFSEEKNVAVYGSLRQKGFIDYDESDEKQPPKDSTSSSNSPSNHAQWFESIKVEKNKKFAKKEVSDIPYYTIPAGSDVQNATLLTSLIGEVPLNGKVSQPLFPFSAVISRGELMSANGVNLPDEIQGMKIGGYAIGVGSFLDNISCVRAYATSALFVFKDGHFVTVGEHSLKNSTQMVSNKSLGYLTDQYGNPCIKGSYHTNGPQVVAALTVAGAVSNVGGSFADWQNPIVVNAAGTTRAQTGNFGTYLAGKSLEGASSESAAWIKERVSDSFDLVYVPASIQSRNGPYIPNQLMLHFTKTVSIDKKPNSRRVNYERFESYQADNNL